MARKHLTADERYVARILGDPVKSLERALQISRREIHFDMLATQLDELERTLGSVAVRHLLSPVRGPAVLSYSGSTSGTQIMIPGSGTVVYFTTSGGSWTVTVTNIVTLTASGVASGAGGAGGHTGSSGDFNGGGGGGGGASSTGTVVVLVPGKTYTVLTGAPGNGGAADANGTDGGETSLHNDTDASYLLRLGGGAKGAGGAGGAGGTASTGSNTFTGGAGANGIIEPSHTPNTGSSQTSGAGGGGGGGWNDATLPDVQGDSNGGAGKDETGTTAHGGGMDFNGTKCGGGGGGGQGASPSFAGKTGEQGGAKLAA